MNDNVPPLKGSIAIGYRNHTFDGLNKKKQTIQSLRQTAGVGSFREAATATILSLHRIYDFIRSSIREPKHENLGKSRCALLHTRRDLFVGTIDETESLQLKLETLPNERMPIYELRMVSSAF